MTPPRPLTHLPAGLFLKPAYSDLSTDEEDKFDNGTRHETRVREILSQLASFGYAVSRDELEQTVRDTNQRQSAYYANRTARGRAVNPEMSDRTGIGDQFNQYSISLIRLLTRKMGTSGPEDWAITFKEN
ncbi:MAG: hypothetical protein AB7P49_15350, partial [Bdellovibrionales bacterium]